MTTSTSDCTSPRHVFECDHLEDVPWHWHWTASDGCTGKTCPPCMTDKELGPVWWGDLESIAAFDTDGLPLRAGLDE